MSENDPRFIFISYEQESGLRLATAIRSALRSERIAGWVWQLDHPSGYVFSQIAKRINEADYICWVCTAGTIGSEGQAWEIENAFGQGKLRRTWVVALDRNFVPLALRGYYQYQGTPRTVHAVVTDWVWHCRNGFSGWPSLENDIAKIKPDEGADITETEIVDEDNEQA